MEPVTTVFLAIDSSKITIRSISWSGKFFNSPSTSLRASSIEIIRGFSNAPMRYPQMLDDRFVPGLLPHITIYNIYDWVAPNFLNYIIFELWLVGLISLNLVPYH